MAALYRQRISALCERLGEEGREVASVGVLGTLVERVALVPEGGALSIVLRGDLAALLMFATNEKRPGFLSKTGLLGDLLSPLLLVAGTRFTRYLRISTTAIPLMMVGLSDDRMALLACSGRLPEPAYG